MMIRCGICGTYGDTCRCPGGGRGGGSARWMLLGVMVLLVVALVRVSTGCVVQPASCQQPVFTTAPGHAHPPIEVICR